MKVELLSYIEALAVMRTKLKPHGRLIKESLREAQGLTLAADVRARTAHPKFDDAAVDGYAVGCREDSHDGSDLKVARVNAAGSVAGEAIPRGQTVRIFTGAPIPPGTHGLAMQEDVEVNAAAIVLRTEVQEGAHIRRAGSDFVADTVLLKKGDVLGPGALALLASQGVCKVTAFDHPRIGIVTIGDELVALGAKAATNQIYESNGSMLAAQAAFAGAGLVKRCLLGDTPAELRTRLQELSSECDLIIVSGGASVGDRDFLPSAVAELGEVHFHGVRIRPGKPMLFGQINRVPVFALPGNPASSFVCFELFVAEAIHRLAARRIPAPLWLPVALRTEHTAVERDEFLRCTLTDGVAEPVSNQGSFGLRSLADGDCLVHLPAGMTGTGVSQCQAILLHR